MGAANGTALRLVDADVELRRETKDFARWTLGDVEDLHRRFQKSFGFAVTASQFESLLLLKAPDSVGIDEIFDALDANRDGRVDGLELLAALACVCRASFEDKARFAFELFDFNHNGSLSVAELALLMKSVLVGMTLLTGGSSGSSGGASPLTSQSAPDSNSSMEAMLLCLGLAESAFSCSDSAAAALGFEAFIAWARSNREFMLQVERFRLIAEKAVGFEDALSLPNGSDDDSDLDAEEAEASDRHSNVGVKGRTELPAAWMIEPIPPSFPAAGKSPKKDTGMPPPANLQLEWVYGTNGPSTRNACRLLVTGEAAYFVGNYAILYSSEPHEQRYYRGHRRAIGCLDVNAAGEIVATGDANVSSNSSGESAEIHVWSARTLQCLAVLRNFHPSGVAHVSFPAAASAATTTLRQAQALSLGERSGAGGNSPAILSSSLMKKKPQDTEALLASIGSDAGGSMALWHWQREAIVASGRAHPAAAGQTRRGGGGKRALALALNEDGDEIVVCGAHFVVFHHVGGRFFKHKKPHWHGDVDPPVHTVPVCLSAVYYGLQSAVIGTARGELLLFERHVLTRCIQAHDVQSSVNVCLLSCHSMVLISAGKDGQIKQWDSTLRPIGQALDLHTLRQAAATTAVSSASSRPENALEGDEFRVSSLAYDAQRRRFLVATRAGNILEVDDETSAPLTGSVPTTAAPDAPLRWRLVALGHSGQPTRGVATASAVGGCFASCGFGDHGVKLWSLRRRAFVQQLRFPGAGTAPSALAFSSDGERLAIGGEDGTLMLARRTGSSSSSAMAIEVTMKNTSSGVALLRVGPTKPELLLAVARANGLIYLYKLESGGRQFTRYALLKTRPQDSSATATNEAVPVCSLDFSTDGAFLRSQHGASELCFWDLHQRGGTRVTSMAVLRNVEWHTHSTSIGWSVAGLPSAGVCVVGNANRGLALALTSNGDLELAPFPCPALSSTAHDSSERSWITRVVPRAHLVGDSTLPCSSTPPLSGGFALRGSVAITSSRLDPVICQWRVEKELDDVQPRSACVYDSAFRKRLQLLGLPSLYFDQEAAGAEDHEAEDDTNDTVTRNQRRLLPRQTAGGVLVAVRGVSESSLQRSEAPDLALTLSYVDGLNHREMSGSQALACLGNGLYVYSAGALLIVRHLRSFGSRQRIMTSGLQRSVSCIVKHTSEPVLAVGSRTDGRVLLFSTDKPTANTGASTAASFQQVATLLASDINGQSKGKTLVAVAFSGSSTRTTQSDLVAVIWKETRSHVYTLAVYAWKRQLLLAQSPMTRLPVLFGIFAGSATGGVQFVSGGVDHVTFWLLNPATGHVTAQQGVFGRHALVQTALCAVYVAPFVLTGTEDGSLVLWEGGVAAHTAPAARSTGAAGNGAMMNSVAALEHLAASQQVLGVLRNGTLVVWRYSNTNSARGGRVQASTFLQLTRELAVVDLTKSVPISTGGASTASSTYVRSMCILDDAAVAAITLSSGRVVSVELETILDDSATNQWNESSLLATPSGNDQTRVLLDFNSVVNDVALHPRELRWASASADGRVSVWNLHTNLLLQQQVMPSIPRALAWSATGEHLAVSLSNGVVSILDGVTLALLLQFVCGESESLHTGQTQRSSLSKWCSKVKYSPLSSQSTATGSASTRSWLALACRDLIVYVYTWESTGSSSAPDASAPVYTLLHTFVGHTAPIEALDFSFDGQWLQSATACADSQLLRWRIHSPATPALTDTAVGGLTTGWELLDDSWASWTPTFSGPAAGLAEGYGVGHVTSLARVNGEGELGNASDTEAAKSKWKSPLPTMLVGLEDGQVLLVWYPLPCGDSSSPRSLAKAFVGSFSRGSVVRRVAFSFANAFVVALAQDPSGSTQVLVWKTDYDDELRLRQRYAPKAAALSGSTPPLAAVNGYVSPVDRTLFEYTELALKLPQGRPDAKPTGSTFDAEELHLEFIYGLNAGATGSRNVFYADDAWEIVYTAGSCGVVYNTKTQTQLLNRPATSDSLCAMSALAVHPKGDLVVSGECLVASSRPESRRGAEVQPALVVWDANSGSTILRVATIHRRGVLLLAFCPDGQRLASIGMEVEHTLALYGVAGGSSEAGRLHVALLLTVKTSSRRVWGLSLGDEGDAAICGDQHISFWQQGSERGGGDETQAGGLKSGLLSSHRDCNTQATLLQMVHLPGRARVVVSSQADGSLYLWKDRVCMAVRRGAHGEAAIPALTIDRKQSLLYSAGADGRICAWNDQLELVRVVADVVQLGIHSPPTPLGSTSLQSLAVRDDRFLFSTANGEVCELVEGNSSLSKGPGNQWRLLPHVRSHASGQIRGLAVHPAKRAQFASAGDDGSVRLWDAATRSLLALHQWDSGSAAELRALAFSPDGKHLAVGTADGVVRVLTTTLEAVVTQWSCFQGHSHAVLALRYSPDGKLLAVGTLDGSVHVYNAVSYRKLAVLTGETGQTVVNMCLDFAQDRAVLRVCSCGSGDQKLQHWELGSWRATSSDQMREVHWETRSRPGLSETSTQICGELDLLSDAVAASGGHVAGVTSCVVTKNELFLLSAGGADRSICQFRLQPHAKRQ